jgi:FKBP-type peptidyl-prolyl cis-trans isomerase FkpA
MKKSPLKSQSAWALATAAALFSGMAAHAAQPVTTSSGLVYESITEGTGASPKATDTVKVHYRGYFPETGKEFDSSYARQQPIDFPLNGVIPCWTEGLQKMKVGGKAKLTCPPSIAYGSRGAGRVIPPNATLNFDVELLDVKSR